MSVIDSRYVCLGAGRRYIPYPVVLGVEAMSVARSWLKGAVSGWTNRRERKGNQQQGVRNEQS